MNRREVVKAALATTLLPFGHAFAQQGYPSQNVTFIVPFTPGGSTDIPPGFWEIISSRA